MRALKDDKEVLINEEERVSIYPITQATRATFTDLYFRLTCLFFIQRGEKGVETQSQGKLLGTEGDLMIFPPGALVTMENRPVVDAAYQATGISFSHDLIDAVFAKVPPPTSATDVQIVRADPLQPLGILELIRQTLEQKQVLPGPILRSRLLEPLVWLRENGVSLPSHIQDQPISKVRRLIETNLRAEWRASEVAQHFGMSESTFRRWLSKSGHSFAKTLLNMRLESGLSALQTTNQSISEIALDSGFKTPSHFSDAFRKRFGITPKDIRLPSN